MARLSANGTVFDPVGVLREEVFRYYLSHEISRAVRYRDFFSICLVGVSAKTGDLLGTGGELVRKVSKALGEKLRETDPIGVLPEGFGVILLNVADGPALTVSERLRIHVREVAVPVNGHIEPVTVSVGGACFPRDGQSETTLLTHAVQCLTLARQRGGDRVVYHPSETY